MNDLNVLSRMLTFKFELRIDWYTNKGQIITLQKTADLATDFSDGFYPLQFNDGLATTTNLATDLPTDNIPSPK